MNKGMMVRQVEDEITRFVEAVVGMGPGMVPPPLVHGLSTEGDVVAEILRVITLPWFCKHYSEHAGAPISTMSCHICGELFRQVEHRYSTQARTFFSNKLRYYFAERELS